MAATVASLPTELANAINQAGQKYGVPPDLLGGIWRIESGSTYPNPAVNSSGYGGLFGTTDPYGSTQEQANLAASVLATGLQKSGGNISEALSYYNSGRLSGGYTSVPGETTFGNVKAPNSTGPPTITTSSSVGGGLTAAQIKALEAAGIITGNADTGTGSAASGASQVKNAVAGPISSVGGLISFVTSYRFLEIIGGGVLVILGVVGLMKELTGVSITLPGPAGVAQKAVDGPISSQPRSTQRRAGFAPESRESDARAARKTRIDRAAAADTGDIPY